MFRKLGIQSLEDVVYFWGTTLIAGYGFLILVVTVYQETVGDFLYLNNFFFYSLNIQFPYLLFACIVLMCLNIFNWLFMTLASIFYRKKEKPICWDDSSLISVLIPAHNEENVIGEILKDLVNQKYRNLEILVLAHNCSDRTVERAQSIKDERIRVINYKTRKSGKALSLNEGLGESRGEIIAHFDADNRIKDSLFFNKAIAYFQDKDVAAIQAALAVTNSKSSILSFLQEVEYDIFSSVFWQGRAVLGLPALLAGTGTLLRKDVLAEVLGWENSLVEDFDLFTRLTAKRKKIVYANNITTYDEKPSSWSGIMKQRSRWIKGSLKIFWDYLDYFGNLFDYLYRLLPLVAFSWWVLIFLYFFYFFTGQTSMVSISGWFCLAWNLAFITPLVYTVWRKRGIKGILIIPLYWLFSYHWLWVSLYSLGVTSWQETKTIHFGFSEEERRYSHEHV
jgi:cellulose synthase/poly-beta-1,6-N-acetylglucosamine synthase-like glycosyltransferase